MLNGSDDTLWIPRSSNKSWLTLFYALPRKMVEKQIEEQETQIKNIESYIQKSGQYVGEENMSK